MKRFYELGAAAGLNKAEVNRIARFGVLGLLAFALAGLAACFKAQKAAGAAPSAKSGAMRGISNSAGPADLRRTA